MKTTTVLLLLFFSSFTAFSQQNTCVLNYRVGDNGAFWNVDAEQEVCKGGRLKITCQSVSGATYQWKKDGKIIPNENKQIFYAIEEGVYTAEVQTKDCKYITPKVTYINTIRFNNYGFELNGIHGSIENNEFTICEKGEFFNVNIEYTQYFGEIEYQWQKDGMDVEGTNSSSLYIDKEGVYTVRARQGECLSHTPPLKINITNGKVISPMRLSSATYNFTPKQTDTLYVCENTKMGIGSIYSPFTKHKWYKDDKLIEGVTGKAIDVKESGVYTYETMLQHGCEVKSEKFVVSFGKKISKPTIQYFDSFSGCYGNYLTVSENPFYNNYLRSISGEYKLDWFKNSVHQISTTNIYLSLTESALYKVVVSIGSCSVEDTLRFDPAKPIVFKIYNNLIKNGKITMCEGNEAILQAPSSQSTDNYKLQWYRNGQPIESKDAPLLRVNYSGRYHAIYQDNYNTCVQYSDTIEVTVIKAPYTHFDRVMLNTCTYWLVTEQKDDLTYAWKKDGKLIAGANKFEFFPKESGNYSFVVNRGHCSYESENRSVEILENSVLVEKSVFCENDTLKLKAPEAYSYLWQGPNSFTSNLRNPKVTLSNNSSGFYKLTLSNNGCTFKDSVAIKVNSKPQIQIDKAVENCLGRELILIAQSLKSDFKGIYSWKVPRYKENLEGDMAVVLPNTTKNDEGLYTLTAIDSGCATTVSTEIVFSNDDCNFIELDNGSAIICPNLENNVNFKLNGSFENNEEFNLYSLYNYGKKTLLATGAKSPLKFLPKPGADYTLILESKRKKIFSNLIYLRVLYLYPPVINHQTTQVCSGYSVPLKIDSVHNKYDTIQWFINGIEIPNAHKYSYSAVESGNYSVRVGQNICQVKSDKEIEVKIGQIQKPYINTTYSNTSVCNGFSVPLAASAPRLKDLKYQWQLDNIDIPNAVDSFYIAKQDGEYSLKISQGNCSANSSKTRVTIGHLVAPEINSSYKSSDEIDPKEICAGINRTLMSSGYMEYYFEGGNKFVRPIEGVRFQWQRNDVDISMATGSEYYAKEPGVYQLKVFQGDCMTISKPIDLQWGTFSLYALANQACVGEKINAYVELNEGFTRGIDCKVYKNGEFYKNIKTSEAFEITESGKYDALLIFESPKSGWSCSYYSDTISVEFKDKIINYNLASSSSLATCLDSIAITGKTLAASYSPNYQWKLNDISLPNGTTPLLTASQSGNYQLEIKSNLGCTYLSNPLKIEFNKLEIGINRPDYICSNNLPYLTPEFKSIIYSGNISKPIEYEWQLDGLKIGSDYSQSTLKSGTYSLLVKQGTCSDTSSTKIDIIDIPKALNPNQDSLFTCPNTYFTLEAPQGDYNYIWLRNNQFFRNNNLQKIKENISGTYRVLMEKGECSSVSNSIVVKESKTPVTATISGNKELMSGDSARIKVDFTSLPPWTIKLTNNQEFTATSTPLEFAVKPLQTTVYELASVKNDCGVGTVSGKAEIKILVLGNEEVAGAKIVLYPVPTSGICQLKVETTVPEKLGIQLYNVEGKMLLKSEESKSGSVFNEVINLETIPDGVYLLKIKIGDKLVTRKIIKGN